MASTELLGDRDIAERYSRALERMRETTSTETSHRHVTRPKRSLATGRLKKHINESLPTQSIISAAGRLSQSYGKNILLSGLMAASAVLAWKIFSTGQPTRLAN